MATYTFIDSSRLIGLERAPIEVVNRGEASFKADLQEIFEGIQADRTAMLAQVRELQLAAALLLDAEGARLASIDPADDRIAALAASSRIVIDRSATLQDEIDIAAIRVPLVKKTEALVRGRITDDLNRAAGPVTVTLVDEKGTPVAGVAPVEVDSAGYYAIVVPAEAAASIAPDQKLSLAVSNGAEKVSTDVAPLVLGAGTIKVQDVQLDSARLAALQLGATLATPRASPRTAPKTGAAKKRAAKSRAPVARKSAAGGTGKKAKKTGATRR